MKRYIYIIIGIIVAAAIAILILFLIKQSTGSSSLNPFVATTGSLPAAGTQGSNNSGTTSGVSTLGLSSATSSQAGAGGQVTVSKFGVLSQDPILDYFVDAQNNITAIEPSGAVVAISNGQSTTINSSTINNIISASFSYDGKKILVSFGGPSNPQMDLFDVATNAWLTFPKGIQSPQWSPTNNYQIAYLAMTGSGKLALATINAANLKTVPSVLLTLNANDLTLQWPTKSEMILADKPTSQNAGSIWAFNTAAGTLTPLIYEVSGAEGIWSHNASIPYGLTFFNSVSGQGDTLQLQAFMGGLATQPLSFLTLPSKCAFDTEQMAIATSTSAAGAGGAATSTASSTTSSTASSMAKKNVTAAAPAAATSTPYLALYCGIPRSSSGFSSAHLPDDYLTMALFTSDDIYKINTATGGEQVLWSDAAQNMDTSDMKFANNALFFVNRYDQKLYGLTFN
jgi:hypothetical protein